MLFVLDNRVGLSPEELGQVFTIFSQVQSENDRSEGGLGIGLALVKGLVELHAGRVEAQSEGHGKGSRFVVTLPHTLVIEAQAESTSDRMLGTPPGAAAACIVIADDNRDGVESLGMYMQSLGHEVHIADTGHDALALASKHRPQVVILDISMPGLSGYDVAKLLRREAWGRQMKLVAVTGWGQDDDKRLADVAGFDHHFTKPVGPEELVKLFPGSG